MKHHLLVIESSMIAGEASFSRALSKLFMDYYRVEYPEDEITYLDLNDVAMAKKTLTSANFATYFNPEDSDVYINQLKASDKLVIATPMTNFNYPATLKNYLDHILVADKTFSYKYSRKGDSVGLLPHLKVQILATQGAPLGWYEWGNHVKMLEGTLNFVGAKVYPSILFDGTKVFYKNQKPAEAVLKIADQVKKAVQNFK